MTDDPPRDRAFRTHEVQRRDVASRVALQDGATEKEVAALRAALAEADAAFGDGLD